MLYSLSLMFMILSCAKEKVVEHPYAGLSSEYFESFSDIDQAIRREKLLKEYRREKKNQLVESINPNWNDLSEGLQ